MAGDLEINVEKVEEYKNVQLADATEIEKRNIKLKKVSAHTDMK